MNMRTKKLVGFLAAMPLLMLYLFGVAALGELLPDIVLLKTAFYLVMGIAWAFPFKYLMTWMGRE